MDIIPPETKDIIRRTMFRFAGWLGIFAILLHLLFTYMIYDTWLPMLYVMNEYSIFGAVRLFYFSMISTLLAIYGAAFSKGFEKYFAWGASIGLFLTALFSKTLPYYWPADIFL